MSELERLAGSVIVTGFPGDRVDDETLDALRALGPGGVVLFDRNVSTLAGTRTLVATVRDTIAGDVPALVCVDQEGGRVARSRFREPGIPAMLGLGAADDVRLAERAGIALANDVRAIGANVDFAPVLDLALAPESAVIGTRSFGDDPARTAKLGAAFVRGMQSRAVAATAKHFPGHGATALDSHRDLPVVDTPLALLRAREFVPFVAAISGGVRAIMSAHVVVSALDAALPATLSKKILTGVLRAELGFDGVCFTDCLQMQAIANGIGSVRAGVLALEAGADVLLVSHDLALARALRDALVAAVTSGDLPLARLEDAARRVNALRAGLAEGAIPADVPADDTALAIARAAVALVRGNPRLDPAVPITIVSFEGELADGVARARATPSLGLALRRLRYRAEVMRVPLEPEVEDVAMLLEVLRAQGDRALVILARRAHLHARQAAAIRDLIALARHAVVVSVLEPFDVPALEAATTLLCTFGDEEANVDALADVLAGAARANGSFPVSLASESSRRLLTEAEIDAKLPKRGRARALADDAPGDDAESGGA